jgi:hypothetical protein
MEIKSNRYGHERVYEKISSDKIRITGETIFSRTNEDDFGNIKMFDFEGGPCVTVGGTLNCLKGKWIVKKISIDTSSKIENLAAIVCEVSIK